MMTRMMRVLSLVSIGIYLAACVGTPERMSFYDQGVPHVYRDGRVQVGYDSSQSVFSIGLYHGVAETATLAREPNGVSKPVWFVVQAFGGKEQ